MKKFIKIIINAFLLSIMLITLLFNNNVNVHADTTQATSKTYAIDIRYHDVLQTQDAYLPEKAVIGIGLNKPVDMFIDEQDNIYICDSAAAKIYQYDSNSKSLIYTLSYVNFKTPKGICIVTDNNNNKLMYVADSSAKRVFVFKYENNEYVYYKEYEKPTSLLFANNEFSPAKVTADRAGNMYIIGEGVLDGIIQLSNEGDFLGYFSSNKVKKSLKEKMQEWIYDDSVLDMIGTSQPPTFTNVCMDSRGLVYSTTAYSASRNYNRVKKHNTSGASMIDPIDAGNSPTDIFVGQNDMIYVGWSDGYISTYTEEGDLLFIFGGQSNDNIAGLFKSLSSVAVDSNNNIWCLDSDKVAIHQFKPTDYTKLIYEAHDLYYNRDYEKSIIKWKEVLALNQVSAIAHNQLGLNYLYSQDYKNAMKHLKLAGDRANYSQAFWEVRNIWLQKNLGFIVILLVLVAVGIILLQHNKIKKGVNQETTLSYKINHLKLVQDMKFNMSVLKSPYDSFYYVRTNKKGSTLSCIITMFIIFAIFLWFNLGKGFIFQYINAADVDILALIVGYFGIIGLVTFCNWLVSSIQDGEGTFLAIYRTVIISLIPYAISMVLVILLSYVATTNEAFLLQLFQYVGIGLSIITLFLGIQNIHFYSFKKTIISFLLTILLIAIIVLVILLLIILSTKLIQFIEILLKEVFR